MKRRPGDRAHRGRGADQCIASPAIKGSYAALECRVITSFPVGKYVMYLAEAVDYRVNETAVPLAWLSNRYYALKDPVG